ncbi:MAG: sulfotransferase [Spirochaetia bacterium]|nr:sulfotransferase [Spirochaetia bacterium]
MNLIYSKEISEKINNSILICGSARSGTTILGKLLHSLKDVEYFFEPNFFLPLFSKYNELSKQSFRELYELLFYDQLFIDSLAGRNINTNPFDDSSIYDVKSKEDIKKRHVKSYRRTELIEISKNKIIAYKHPGAIFFIEQILKLFPNKRVIVINRNANDIINSLLNKKWFSNDSMNVNDFSKILPYPIKVINNLVIPFWVPKKDFDYWINASELERCAFYVFTILKSIINIKKNCLLINYEEFIKNPKLILDQILNSLNLSVGEKTVSLLKEIKYQKKDRKDYLSMLKSDLKNSILELEIEISDFEK